MSATGINWEEKASRLASRFPLVSLAPGVVQWLQATPTGEPLGLACSGGADSLCLLLLTWAHYPERRPAITVLHFDHRLRGEASRGDAAFVDNVARGLGLAVRQGTWDRGWSDPVSEETARTARFSFFCRELGHLGGKVLLFGHQRDDIVESQLMRLSRGSGTAGLAAPRPVQALAGGRWHLRPLLSLGGAEIRQALGELEIPFRLDASNETPGFYRNRIRLEILPLWQQHSPFDVSAGAAASRELLEEDDEALGAWLRELLPPPVSGQPLELGPLRGKPRALLRRALREWLLAEQLGETLKKAAFESLLGAAERGERCRTSAGSRFFLEMDADGLLRKTASPGPPPAGLSGPWPLPLSGEILLPGRRRLRARGISLDSAARARILCGRVETEREAFIAWQGGRLSVRHWQPGDRFRPLGAPGSRKLQDIFVDLKIPEAERYRLPVVLMDNRIVWIPGLPPGELFKISNLTKSVVQLTYTCGEAV